MLYRGHSIVLSSQLNELTFIIIRGGYEVLSHMPFGYLTKFFNSKCKETRLFAS